MDCILAEWKEQVAEIKANLYDIGEKGDSLHYNLLATEAMALSQCIMELQDYLLSVAGKNNGK